MKNNYSCTNHLEKARMIIRCGITIEWQILGLFRPVSGWKSTKKVGEGSPNARIYVILI